MAVVDMVDQEKPRPGFHYTPHGVYVHGLGGERMSTVEFDGPPRQVEPLTVEELQDSIRRVSGTDVTITTMSSGTRWIDAARQAATYRTGRVLLAGDAAHVYAPVGGQGLNVGIVGAANLGWKLAAVVCGWVGEDILDTYTTERHPVAARLLQNTPAQIALMRPDPQTRALWEMFSDLMDLDDAHRYVADMLAGMDVRYDLGDDHRLVGTLCPDMKLTLERPDPDVVTAVTGSADLLREGRIPPKPPSTRGLEHDHIQESANSRASDRTAQKIRRQEQGHEYAEAQLTALGAPVPRPGGNSAVWLREVLLAVGARNVRHRGAHRFVYRLGRNRREREQIKLGFPARQPYPKEADPEPIGV
ncbi:FAD-dependent monooxygenase [Streptomyces phaeochromogenes]